MRMLPVPNHGPELVRRRMFAEVDEARLVGMEFEPMPAEPFGQGRADPLGVLEALERHHEVGQACFPASRGPTSLSNHSSST